MIISQLELGLPVLRHANKFAIVFQTFTGIGGFPIHFVIISAINNKMCVIEKVAIVPRV